MKTTLLTVLVVASVLPLAAYGCADINCETAGTCGAPTADGGDVGADALVACDPSVDASCVDEQKGLFVDGQKGGDANPGTKAAPLKTLAGALAKLQGKTRVYVCAGTYPESVELTASASLYGGFACDTWQYAKQNLVRIEGVPDKPALTLRAPNVTIADLTFVAANARAPGASSVAALVANAQNATFLRAELKAQAGAPANDSTLVDYTFPAPQNGGNAPDNVTGGAPGKVACPNNKNGDGGKGGNVGSQGDDGGPAGLGGAKGQVALCGVGGTGLDGKPGLDPAPAPGASKHGTLSENGFQGEPGTKGEDGGPGGGGGGGYGTMGAGGGGGSGGCGGAGPSAPTAGGSSLALVVFTSPNTSLVASTLQSLDAKKGGNGTQGQTGQLTFGFRGNGSGGACSGGNGAPGGKGASSGGGAGGLSAGIVWQGGTAPRREADTTITHGQGAPGGDADNKGKDGVRVDVLAL